MRHSWNAEDAHSVHLYRRGAQSCPRPGRVPSADGLTQAQMAMRMNVRQERVAAIGRADPGATEVRALAACVQAFGGTLEIIVSIGDERIMLG
jgi:hypothetical protein